MSDRKTVIGDEMVEAKLKENSNRLCISIDDLIERYVRRGLVADDFEPLEFTMEELNENNKFELERERKMGLKPPEKTDLMFSLTGGLNLMTSFHVI